MERPEAASATPPTNVTRETSNSASKGLHRLRPSWNQLRSQWRSAPDRSNFLLALRWRHGERQLPTSHLQNSMGAGVANQKIDFDFGAPYFLYPGETSGGPTNGIDYWEAAARASTAVNETTRIAAGYAYSPNVSNTGAWSQYAAVGLGYEVPSRLLPEDFSMSFTGAAGYSWFGTQVPALGGFALPSYLNSGVIPPKTNPQLDLRYYDTSLENCYVATGIGAAPVTRQSITNTRACSRWCVAFVAKLRFTLNKPREVISASPRQSSRSV
jgi:hypothetical protein